MAAPVWSTRPAYTPAQIAARFGAGARLVHMGNGRWTVAGITAPAAPAGTAPVPPAPGPLPVSLGRQAGIDSLGEQLGALPGIYNPQRLSLYAEGARGLTDQGYFDRATADVAATGPDGSTSYKVVAGPDGQLYRDATNQTAAAANSRGMLFSSATREATARGATALTNARDAILRRLSSGQDDITRQQTGQATSLRGDLNTAQGDYTDWQATQPVPPPPPPAPGAAAKAPAGPAGPNNPRNPGSLKGRVWWGTDRYARAIRRAR